MNNKIQNKDLNPIIVFIAKAHLACHMGGTDLEREYGDVQPWRPPFHASVVVCKGPLSSKRA